MSQVQAAIQERIDAQQSHDLIEYGIRSIRACAGARRRSGIDAAAYCHGIHAAQVERAKQEAAGYGIGTHARGTAHALGAAKKLAAVRLKAAKAAQAECGGVRQLRLALAQDAGAQVVAIGAAMDDCGQLAA